MSNLAFSVEHLGVPARDPVALKDWYLRVLRAELVFDNGGSPPAFFLRLSDGIMLEIYASQSSPLDRADNSLAGWRHVALRVESIDAARAELTSRGLVFTEPVKPAGGGGRVLFFQDPEGNLLHLVERPPGSVFAR